MSDLPRDQIQQAASGLRLRDIALYTARFDRTEWAAPVEQGMQQHKRQVNHRLLRRDGADGQPDRLQVMVALGTRVVSGDEAEDTEIFKIEADFLAEYDVSSCPSEEAAEAFAEYNAVHNVWPFWRQHVFDLVQRGRLPNLEIPLLPAVNA
ncbi:protein-export chaperone SecB [Salinisphaera orenii]|uniref:protein-export chaperone SecB n=1 Tax=Salinisphaera orenii TaxID=856731 RepID=UPI0019550E67